MSRYLMRSIIWDVTPALKIYWTFEPTIMSQSGWIEIRPSYSLANVLLLTTNRFIPENVHIIVRGKPGHLKNGALMSDVYPLVKIFKLHKFVKICFFNYLSRRYFKRYGTSFACIGISPESSLTLGVR